MRVLVTGATGFVGSRLVPALVEAGHDVVALVRTPGEYDAPTGVTVKQGDLLEVGSFEHALADVEAAYYLVHSMQAGAEFEERDRLAARHFTDAADEAGLSRVVYLSGLGDDRDRLSKHLKSRREVERILADGEADVTVLRAAIIVGDGSASFDIVRQLAERLPVMVTPRWVDTDCQPIAIDDVVAYLVGVLDAPATAGNTYQIGGPEVLTYRELIERTAEVATGRRPLVVPVPVLTPRLSSYWLALTTDAEMSVAGPLVDGMHNPVVVDDTRIRTVVDVDPTSFDEAVRRALGATPDDDDHRTAPAEPRGTH
ncbi:NAD(P)H-binding protein [Halomarina rubra]|uniref:NAD(P)H-binding protein n=1 Tax=Halomarina rubra TaxID=2071873 RepID=A0ABD6AX75_9EURY|nr:NAD(P)H-binding protein [Halomarina rubra]